MGLIRFLTPGRPKLTPEVAGRAYITGMDEIPWPCRIIATDDGLTVERPSSESFTFRIPWSLPERGEITLATGSLIQRDKPYLLELELARGTLNRARNQLATWEAAGMKCPAEVRGLLAEATAGFARAATGQDVPRQACDAARDVLRGTLELIDRLAAAYAEQALAVRHRSAPKLTTLFGANLGTTTFDEDMARHYLATFNSALVPMRWGDLETGEGEYAWKHTDRQIEWCQTHKLRVVSGPLLSFDPLSVPDWIYLFEGEADTIAHSMEKYVEAVVARYRGRVQVWQVAARMNGGECLSLADEEKFQIALGALQAVRSADPRTPAVVAFDMPWGEYIRNDADLPMQLADVLVRAGVGLSGIGIELNIGYSPGGTLRRDALEIGRQIDRWSLLGLPLLLSISVPSAGGEDPLARRPAAKQSAEWTPERQREWVRQIVPLLLAKQAVQGIFWRQLRDDEPHEFAHGGLFDAHGRPKPALAELAALRNQHLS